MGTSLVAREVQALVELEQSVLAELMRLDEDLGKPVNAAASVVPAAFESASSSLRAQLRAHTERVERLEELAVIQERPADEADAHAHARRHAAEGAALQTQLRELAVRARAHRAKVEEAERAALFAIEEEFGGASASSAAGGGGSGGLAARASTQAARKVTESLRRTRELMGSELQRFDSTLRELDDQGRSLKSTEEQHRGHIDGSLSAGKRKLTRLQQREQTDRVLIGLAFAFFVLTVLYIVKKRVGLNFASIAALFSPPPPPAIPTPSVSGVPAGVAPGAEALADDALADEASQPPDAATRALDDLVAAAATVAAKTLGLGHAAAAAEEPAVAAEQPAVAAEQPTAEEPVAAAEEPAVAAETCDDATASDGASQSLEEGGGATPGPSGVHDLKSEL
jgi:uncharacterized protein (UPF0335 family)